MSISKSYNKQNGVTYVYEVTENHWDKEKKRPITKRKLIGKIDPETNEIVPTSRRKKHSEKKTTVDYKTLYESTAREASQKEESFLKLKKELLSVLINEQSYLSDIESEIKKKKMDIDALIHEVKNYG